MPKKRKILGSKEVVKILIKYFGFSVIKQRGSHIKCQKIVAGRKITTIVPNHKELAIGTLQGVLDLAEIDREEFLRKIIK
ncbi:MAG: type II toxin-antitoxin system HicA family toxin [Patescibacteria group bacterium]